MGTYTATLTITSNTPGVISSPQTVAVTFTVIAPAVTVAGAPLAVAESSATTDSYTMTLGGAPSANAADRSSVADSEGEISVATTIR